MYNILSVDDEPINQAIVEELLGSQFDITLASSGEECLSNIDSIKPELILLDVSMPGIDGYETCRELKNNTSTCHIPIIFVSARSTLEDKIKGYEAGGYDYITKPFNHSELEVKIAHTIKTVNQSLAEVEKQGQQDADTATIVLPGNIDTTFQFPDSTSLEDLGELLLTILRHSQLNCIFQFRAGTNFLNFSTNSLEKSSNPYNQAMSPLELSMIEQTVGKDRFFDFNNQTIITYPHISLLIKNMPVEDKKLYGEVKDRLETLLASVEAKVEALSNT